MFAGLWAPLLALLAYALTHGFGDSATRRSFGQSVENIALIYLPLSILHRISTTYAVLGTPIMRDELRKDPVRYYYAPAAIAAGCIGLSLAFTFHEAFAFMPTLHARLWAYFLLAYVMFGWERWHFCAQEFGVLSIYRVRAGQTAAEDKRFDRVFTIFMMLGVNTVLVFCAGYADLRQVMLYEMPLGDYRGPLLAPIGLGTFLIGAAATGYAMLRELRHAQRSLPKVFFYLLIGGHPIALYFAPSALGVFFLSYVFHHWMVSVGLFGRIALHGFEAHPDTGERARSAPRRLFFGVAPFLIAALLFYKFFDPLDRAGGLSPVPDAMAFAGASIGAKLLAGVVIGLFFAINYLHYFYDRYFYAFSSPAVRKAVAPLLFRAVKAP